MNRCMYLQEVEDDEDDDDHDTDDDEEEGGDAGGDAGVLSSPVFSQYLHNSLVC